MAAVYLDISVSQAYRRTTVRRFRGARRDDNKAFVQKRASIFEEVTLPLIEYLDSKGRLLKVRLRRLNTTFSIIRLMNFYTLL